MLIKKIVTRFIPAAAVVAGLVFAAPANADAAATKTRGTTKSKTVKAKIALGDKRPGKVKAASKKTKVQAKASAVPCANTTITPDSTNLEVVRAALLCLHNQIRGNAGLPAIKDNAKLRKAAAGHKANIVKKSYKEIGIAVRLGVPSDGTVGATVTADFGAKV